ncbi:MAG: MarR family winged helix-turn-helix transcriptional regulator [Stellaceae bacterium]
MVTISSAGTRKGMAEVSRSQRRKPAQEPWLSATELQAWRAFMRVQMRMNYEMNRQLQSDSDLSLADYHVLNALTDAPGGRLQVSDLAALIGWERSRASHQLRRLCERGLAERVPSKDDGRATDAVLTKAGREAIDAAAPGHVALVRRLFFDPLPPELTIGLPGAKGRPMPRHASIRSYAVSSYASTMRTGSPPGATS